ncbi:PREDICTED: GDSL esterase/lipase At1g71691-like [Lupinus angustifolius]|uniref:GDSL esterase/lipase At1g71691-like n=1 Tax=Lupinus angustifolius TaxID=3871 RepID=UPI00092E5CA2|nr:PREDICTED: GDSL esterase/lipase At1g71691-like [Lupinus angustifolius]
MTSLNAFLVFFFIANHAFFTKVDGEKSLVPALYIFGDSGFDNGNNNNLNTIAKVNKYPYGIDFNNQSTGRFTNGKTYVDLIAIKLGLPLSPPYLGLSESEGYQTLYDLGARKFLVGSVNQLGCSPRLFCNETMNQIVKPYPEKLQTKTQQLQKQLQGSIFVSTNSFNFFTKLKNAPKKYGFTNISKPCYEEGISLCSNRKEYYFWDKHGHTTEAALKIYADESFSGSKLCFPINIKKLALANLR